MDRTAAPHGLAPALRTAGLELVGPAGRGGEGTRWSAQDAAGIRWTVTLARTSTPSQVAAVRQRVDRLWAAPHDHLAPVGAVLDLDRHRVAVLQQEVPGTDLETVRRARGPWAPGEVVTLVVPLAEALAALHAAGVSHGDVAPANVILTPQGRPVLVDLVHGDGGGERGTPATAAPERPGGALPPADVYSLALLGLTLLAGPEAEAGRPTAVATQSEAGPLSACLRRAVVDEPSERPDAAALACAVFAAHPPVGIQMPDPAVLARSTLRRLAEGPGEQRTVRVARVPRQRPRHRRRSRRAAVLLAVASTVMVGAVLAGTAAQGTGAGPSGAGDGPPGATGFTHAGTSQAAASGGPVSAAVRLTRVRAQALARHDGLALRHVTVPGSPAAVADAAAFRRLDGAGGATVMVAVRAVRGLPAEPCRPGTGAGAVVPGQGAVGSAGPCARVHVTARIGTAQDANRPAEHAVVLVMRWTRAGWRVTDVQAPG